MRILLVLLLFLTACTQAGLQGQVVRIVDGDTIDVMLPNERQFRIRLFAIDAPELRQPYGAESRENLAKYCDNATATIDLINVDRYRRLVAIVYCGRTNANLQQLYDGMAWIDERFAPRDNQTEYFYKALEEAQRTNRGLWSESEPIVPRE